MYTICVSSVCHTIAHSFHEWVNASEFITGRWTHRASNQTRVAATGTAHVAKQRDFDAQAHKLGRKRTGAVNGWLISNTYQVNEAHLGPGAGPAPRATCAILLILSLPLLSHLLCNVQPFYGPDWVWESFEFWKLGIPPLLLTSKLYISPPALKNLWFFKLPKPPMCLQMFWTCMINMVTTPAPVPRKRLANQSFSFRKQPWRESKRSIMEKGRLLPTRCMRP